MILSPRKDSPVADLPFSARGTRHIIPDRSPGSNRRNVDRWDRVAGCGPRALMVRAHIIYRSGPLPKPKAATSGDGDHSRAWQHLVWCLGWSVNYTYRPWLDGDNPDGHTVAAQHTASPVNVCRASIVVNVCVVKCKTCNLHSCRYVQVRPVRPAILRKISPTWLDPLSSALRTSSLAR